MVQVKGIMLLLAANPKKHRPAKPFGKRDLNNILEVFRIFYAGLLENTQFQGNRKNRIAYWKEGGRLAKKMEKVRAGVYVEKEVLEQADAMLEAANVRSRNEFVSEALKFYIGYLHASKAENYLVQTLSSVLTSTIQDTENRLARMDFKIAVELSMLAHMIAYHSTNEIDEATFQKLHAKCVEDVKHLNGAVNLDDAYRYQKRKN